MNKHGNPPATLGRGGAGPPHTIGIIGLGLIGGSMAKTLRTTGFGKRFIGAFHTGQNAQEALALGLVDEVLPLLELATACDIIIIAIPVDDTVALLPSLLDMIKEATVVLDAGSTKENICKAIAHHPKRKRFVASHPIAGTENSGPSAAIAGLFEGKVTILCDVERSAADALATTRALYRALQMNMIEMDPAEHDRHLAFVSHLSHISSFMLGLTVLEIEKSEQNIFNLAGSGFASTVRLAKSAPSMWAPIFGQNKTNILTALDSYIGYLQQFRDSIDADKTDDMRAMMVKANDIRRILEHKEKQAQLTVR